MRGIVKMLWLFFFLAAFPISASSVTGICSTCSCYRDHRNVFVILLLGNKKWNGNIITEADFVLCDPVQQVYQDRPHQALRYRSSSGFPQQQLVYAISILVGL